MIATYVNHKLAFLLVQNVAYLLFSVEPKRGHHHYVLLIHRACKKPTFVLQCSLSVLYSNLQTLLFYSQFITDKFLYDQSVAMEGLLDCGLKEQLFELAKVSTC